MKKIIIIAKKYGIHNHNHYYTVNAANNMIKPRPV